MENGPLDITTLLFEDPDGIRIEVNYVPGAGLLSENARLNTGQDNR